MNLVSSIFLIILAFFPINLSAVVFLLGLGLILSANFLVDKISINDAIANGYVKLSKNIKKIMEETGAPVGKECHNQHNKTSVDE